VPNAWEDEPTYPQATVRSLNEDGGVIVLYQDGTDESFD